MSKAPDVMILGKNVLKDIIENDRKAVGFILEKAKATEVIVPASCLVWGLEMAEKPSFLGMRALAELLSLSRLEALELAETRFRQGKNQFFMTPDVLLGLMIGMIREETIREFARISTIRTSTAMLITALLCLEKGDAIDTQNLAKALKLITLDNLEPGETGTKSSPQQNLDNKNVRSLIRNKLFRAGAFQ